jgi:phenylalanyl-tRNA synthetase beta chain
VFHVSEAGEYLEELRVTAAVQGDYLRAKGIVENLFAALRADLPEVSAEQHAGMHPGRSASLTLGGEAVGWVAEADPDMLDEHLDLGDSFGRVACFELRLAPIAASLGAASRYKPLPRFPEVSRDLAMVFAAATPYAGISKVASEAAGPLLESLRLLSVYTGERVEPGKKSVALRFTLRAADHTLTDADADAVVAAAESALAMHCGAAKR